MDEVFAVAAGAIEVPALRADVVAERAGAACSRRRKRLAAVVAAGVLVVAGGTLVGLHDSGSPSPGPAAPSVVAVDNPAPTAWWANDVLYLEHAAVQLPRVLDLVDLGQVRSSGTTAVVWSWSTPRAG